MKRGAPTRPIIGNDTDVSFLYLLCDAGYWCIVNTLFYAVSLTSSLTAKFTLPLELHGRVDAIVRRNANVSRVLLAAGLGLAPAGHPGGDIKMVVYAHGRQ